MRNVKKSHWAIIVYPDSAPVNWKDILQDTGLEVAISPLHDMDVNPDNTKKKPHYHVILNYSNNTTFKNVKENVCDLLNSPIPQPLESLRGYVRYLVHKDNPEKFQYNRDLITTLNGFCINKYFDTESSVELVYELSVLTDFIHDNNITEYHDFIELVKSSDSLHQYLHTAMTKTMFLNAYIKSLKYKIKEKTCN